jgi:hypothetical protein
LSVTTSIGVVGPSHWTYMAAVMAHRLTRILEAKRVRPNDVPVGVHRDVQKFFHLVRQAAGNSLPQNPPASINAYVIASDAVRVASPSLPTSRQKLGDCFERYEQFVKGLNRPRALTVRDTRTAKNLLKFFLYLKQEGEAESYAKAFHQEEQPLGFPLF